MTDQSSTSSKISLVDIISYEVSPDRVYNSCVIICTRFTYTRMLGLALAITMEKILVKWTDGRSKGTSSLVKRSTVKGTIAVGERVEVAWGKSKKKYYAVVLNVGGECRSQDIPQQGASVPQQGDTTPQQGDAAAQQGVSVPQQNTGVEDEPFAFEMVPSAPLNASTLRPSSAQPTPLNSLSSIMEKLESLADAVAGIEARMLCRFDSLEAKIAALQHIATESTPQPVRESCVPPLFSSIPEMPMAGFANEPPPETTTPLAQLPMYSAFESPTIPLQLQDVSDSYLNVSSAGGSASYHIPAEDIAFALNACRSRRNLAGRLAAKIFSQRERATSNCRGKLGKTALNSLKVKAIYSTCMKYYPLQRLESTAMADREMRNAIDEICRKSRAVETENTAS